MKSLILPQGERSGSLSPCLLSLLPLRWAFRVYFLRFCWEWGLDDLFLSLLPILPTFFSLLFFPSLDFLSFMFMLFCLCVFCFGVDLPVFPLGDWGKSFFLVTPFSMLPCLFPSGLAALQAVSASLYR